MVKEDEDDEEVFVGEVRQTFFNFLKPFLRPLPDCFKDEKEINALSE